MSTPLTSFPTVEPTGPEPVQEDSDEELIGFTTVRDPETYSNLSDESNLTDDTNLFSNTPTCSVTDMDRFISMVKKVPATKVMEIPKNPDDAGVLANMLSLEGQALSKILTFVAEDLKVLDYEGAIDTVLDSLLQSGIHQIFDKVDLGRRGSGAMVLALCANCLILISLWNLIFHLIIKGMYRMVSILGRHLKLHGFKSCECKCHLSSQTEAGSDLGQPIEQASQEQNLENGRDNDGFEGENLGGGVNAGPALGFANPHADYGVDSSSQDGFVQVNLMDNPFEGGDGAYFEHGAYVDPLLALRDPIPQKSIFRLSERRPQGRPWPDTSFLGKLLKVNPPTIPGRKQEEYIEMSDILKNL